MKFPVFIKWEFLGFVGEDKVKGVVSLSHPQPISVRLPDGWISLLLTRLPSGQLPSSKSGLLGREVRNGRGTYLLYTRTNRRDPGASVVLPRPPVAIDARPGESLPRMRLKKNNSYHFVIRISPPLNNSHHRTSNCWRIAFIDHHRRIEHHHQVVPHHYTQLTFICQP